MSKIPNARISPRIVNGVLFFYWNDTFDLGINLDIRDQDGELVQMRPADVVTAVFRNKRNEAVKTFTFTGIENNYIVLTVDEATSALFKPGEYTYDLYLNGDERTTLVNDNQVVVE